MAEDWQAYLDDNQSRFLDELLAFLRLPSVSSLSEHDDDVRRTAHWVADRMKAAGIEHVNIMPTGGHPVVYGDWLHAEAQPTIMIYGHFDVQPADPIELWTSPPFAPVVRNGRVYARGASDDKGNMLIPILAAEALLAATGELPINVKFLFEGQEEIGSPQLRAFLSTHRDLLACDLVVSADGGQYGEDQPALIIAFKGVCALQVDVVGPERDLHSGLCGGAVQNPIHALAHILASMHDTDGRIAVDGFYDSVEPLSDDDRRQIAEVPYDEGEYKEWLGVDALFCEAGYTTNERTWARPTLEVNGIWGGFQGEGIKTVIPSVAHAKITCRLVPNQEPVRIVEAITRHVAHSAPPGVRVTTTPFAGSAPPFFIPADHPGNLAAASVLEEIYGKPPYILRVGGTLPICSLFKQILGLDSVNFAFALTDENFHAPDEFFRLTSFETGQRAYCLLLERLGKQGI
jgi:acetylornithine deacetylase/succinyl-diaminopimelate desuccinylase-like protein